MRFVHTLRFLSFPAIVLGTALTLACSDGGPTAPDEAPSLAVTSGPLSVDVHNLRFQCMVGGTCTSGLVVSASSSVTLSYQIDGAGFIINEPLTDCPQNGTLLGGCFLNVKVASAVAGRYRATLLIADAISGTTLTVRLSARVS